ncbi:Uncharacterised protein [Mycobacteroides abscessus subsp. massiliense]|nr:Uncharacterised protein [Mycobacteroides abscessus subsp. massiliense]
MATPDVDVDNALNGVQEVGSFRPWAWVHVRARTVFGNLSKNAPFSRSSNAQFCGWCAALKKSANPSSVGLSPEVMVAIVAPEMVADGAGTTAGAEVNQRHTTNH